MRLTRGEGWWLHRRRCDLTAEEFARRLGVSRDRLREMERDRRTSALPPIITERIQLTDGEYATIMRRRAGWPACQVADRLGVSLVTLRRMERDRTRTAYRAASFWASRRIEPRPRAPAPVVVERPAKTTRRSTEDRGGRR